MQVTIGALKRLTSLMAGQDNDAVDINGGSIDGTTIGGSSAAAGTFTTISATTYSGVGTRTPASITGTVSLTAAANANRLNIITGTAAATLTLPEATGTGNVYPFVFAQVNTNGTVIQTADNANCSIRGSLNILDADSNAQTAYHADSGDDTITINGTTKGGLVGDTITLIDIGTDLWAVSGNLVCPAGSNVADMFSSAA